MLLEPQSMDVVPPDQPFSNISTQIPQGACLKANSDPVDLQWGLRFSRSNKLQGDADAASSQSGKLPDLD